MTKLLILGCSHAEIPLIEVARSRGCFVGVVGSDPDGLGMRIADARYVVDYSDSDSVLGIVKRHEYRGLVAGCNDFAELTRVSIESQYPTRASDTVTQSRVIHHKDRFRNLCTSLKLPSPRALVLTSYTGAGHQVDQLQFPVVVKPTDLTGGKGVRVCHNRADLAWAIAEAQRRSRRDEVVIEEFLQGRLGSACFWQADGHLHLLTHADESMYLNPFLVAAAVAPSSIPLVVLESLTRDVEKISTALKLTDGIFHVQFLHDGYSYAILEVCRRPPGDLYLKLPTAIGLPSLADLIVDQALGITTKIPLSVAEVEPTIRMCIMAPKNGVLENWRISPKLREIAHEVLELKPSQCVITDFMTEKLAIVLASHENRQFLEFFAANPAQALEVNYISSQS